MDFHSTGLSFEYLAESVILSMTPPLGPDGGGSRVVIRGKNLGLKNSVTLCDFTPSMSGDKMTGMAGSKYRVSGTWDAMMPHELVCVTPPQQPGVVHVRVSTNGQQFSSDFKAFEFYSTESVTSLTPSTGATQGGYQVLLKGTNFMNTTALRCMFGEVLIPTRYISDGEISCMVPSRPTKNDGSGSGSGRSLQITGSETVSMKVSNNGIDFSPLGMVFTFVQSVDVQRVYPISGPVSGGSLVYFITRSYMNASELVCVFNGSTSPVVQAYGGLVVCRTPPPPSIPNGVTIQQDRQVFIDVALSNSVAADGSIRSRYAFLLYKVNAYFFVDSCMQKFEALIIVISIMLAGSLPLFSSIITVPLPFSIHSLVNTSSMAWSTIYP